VTDISILKEQAQSLLNLCLDRQIMLATAESCTGGLIVGLLTELSGSSAVVERGFVTYSNEAKAEMLGVPAELIETVGAVSREVAMAMAAGAIEHSRAGFAISVTGIAGPSGGSAEKPVGMVHFGTCLQGQPPKHSFRQFEDTGRDGIRLAAIGHALEISSNVINSLK